MKSPTIYLGIHISDQDMALVAVEPHDEQIRIVAWDCIAIAPGEVHGGRIKEIPQLAQRISAFTKKHKLRISMTTISLTINVARLKVSDFKASSDEDLHHQIMQELERYNLYGHENTYATYRVMPTTDESDGQVPVMQFMTSRGAGDNCLMVAKKAKLNAPVLEASVLPLLRMLNHQGTFTQDEVSLLCVFDADAGLLCVLKQGVLAFYRPIEMGIKDILNDPTTKDQLRNLGGPVIEYAQSMTDHGLKMFVAANSGYNDLRTVVTRLRMCFKGVKVRQLSSAQFTKTFDIPAHPKNKEIPILGLSNALAPHLQTDSDDPVNLIQPEALAQIKVQREISWLGKAVAAIVIFAVAAIVPVHLKTRSVQANSTAFEEQIAATRPIQAKKDATEQEMRSLEKYIKSYQMETEQFSVLPWPQFLAVLVKHVPSGELRFLDLTTNQKGLFELRGEARVETVVQQFLEQLEKDAMVASAEADEVIYEPRKQNLVIFQISGQLALDSRTQGQ